MTRRSDGSLGPAGGFDAEEWDDFAMGDFESGDDDRA